MKALKYLIIIGLIFFIGCVVGGCMVIKGDGNIINIIATTPEAKVKEVQERLIKRIEDILSHLEKTGSVEDTAELKNVLIQAKDELVRANGSNGIRKELKEYDKPKP